MSQLVTDLMNVAILIAGGLTFVALTIGLGKLWDWLKSRNGFKLDEDKGRFVLDMSSTQEVMGRITDAAKLNDLLVSASDTVPQAMRKMRLYDKATRLLQQQRAEESRLELAEIFNRSFRLLKMRRYRRGVKRPVKVKRHVKVRVNPLRGKW